VLLLLLLRIFLDVLEVGVAEVGRKREGVQEHADGGAVGACKGKKVEVSKKVGNEKTRREASVSQSASPASLGYGVGVRTWGRGTARCIHYHSTPSTANVWDPGFKRKKKPPTHLPNT
jgi:hypothetical protein